MQRFATSGPLGVDATRLELHKALGDDTRYAIYLELARSSQPLSTSAVAGLLGLHVNTVRPHLERLRDVGLLAVHTDASGSVGRPHRLYSLAPDAPDPDVEPTAYSQLARVLIDLVVRGGLRAGDATEAGRAEGVRDAERWPDAADCTEALAGSQTRAGFAPAVACDAGTTVISFATCPYGDLAEEHPDLVCGLHRGMVEGFISGRGDRRSVRFRSLADREPCRAELVP